MTSRTWPLQGVALGCDYNPEQWPRDTWPDDVRLMREAGLTFATLGVFSWALLEPEEGVFDFAWLDEVVDLLHAGGIAVDLATGTASPPPWLSRAYPEILPVSMDGQRLWPGSRQAWCPSSPVFRTRALALVEAMATHYHGHPALAMWHVSNELGCHNARCYCDISAAAFRRWLQHRYVTLDALNDAWGTTFWSQRYSDWEEILPPRRTTTGPNPSHVVDFARFSSDELLDCFRAERDLLRDLSPDTPVTTNFMVTTHFDKVDYWSWAPEQDLVSQDHYLDGRLGDPAAELAFCADLTRGLAGGGPWFLMEHSTSAVNWQPVNYAKEPGELLRNSLTHVARGADAVGFFQWRASRAGAEQFHSALLPHAGTDSKIWRESVELGAVLDRIAGVAGTRVEADAAIIFDWQAQWAANQPNHPSDQTTYADQPLQLHRALRSLGITADVVGPNSDLSRYGVVVIPGLFIVGDALAARVHAFVQDGGHAVITYLSGIVDDNSHIRLGGYGAFAGLLGIRTEEFYPLAPGRAVKLDVSPELSASPEWMATVWSEHTTLAGAQAVATYVDGPLVGLPAITTHGIGKGSAWYVGTTLEHDNLTGLLKHICGVADVKPVVDVGPAVEAVRRQGDGDSYLFVINHGLEHVRVAAHGLDLISGTRVEGELVLAAGGCAVVEEVP